MALTQSAAAELGATAPAFSLPDPAGRLFTRDTCRGPNGLLVMFLCNHCPYVQAIRERLPDDCRELAAAGIGVVAISANDIAAYPDDAPPRMAEVAREFGYPFPYLFDASQDVARAYGAACTPDFFGYDRDLGLRYRGRLDSARHQPRTADTRRELVEAMLQVAETGKTAVEQVPSIGCSIKWQDAE